MSQFTALNEDLYNNLRDNSTSNRLFSKSIKIKTNSSARSTQRISYNVIVSKYDSTLLQLLANKTLHYTLAPASSQDPLNSVINETTTSHTSHYLISITHEEKILKGIELSN